MKTIRQEVESVWLGEIQLDIYFTYHPDFGFDIEAIEDITGTQDLTPILSEKACIEIDKKLEDLYRARGWL